MVISRDFSGRMTLDMHPSKVGPRDYIDALNICRNAQGDAQDGVVSNIVGNRLVSYALPGGNNICIGSHGDRVRGNLIYFVYNSTGKHSILSFNKTSRVITKILESVTDSGGVDILRFDPTHPVMGVDIVHRDTGGDLLLFTDGLNRPRALNIDRLIAGEYTPVPEYAICLAKRPPLDSISVSYGDNTAVKVNNFKKKLLQYKYRWVYQDGYRSTWSPISKVVLPTNAYTLDVDADPTKNNVVYLQLSAGGLDYQKIEIAGRESIGTTYGDFFLIDTLDRDGYSISPNSTYTYTFLNDGAYPVLEANESDQLFDTVPDVVQGQGLVNGNTLVYGGITEGYAPLLRSAVNVQIGASLVDTSPNTAPAGPPTLTYDIITDTPTTHSIAFTVGPNVSTGCLFDISFTSKANVDVSVAYTAVSGDTNNHVANHLTTLITAQVPNTWSVSQSGTNGQIITVTSHDAGTPIFFVHVLTGAFAPTVTQGSAPTWKWSAKYRLGLQYYDQYGKTNGVVSFVGDEGDANDFSVSTPDFVINTANSNCPKVPQLHATINHHPPAWATRFQWVRTPNLSVSSFTHYITCKVDTDSHYLYFCIANLDKYKLDNTGFVPSYTFSAGDRLRVMGSVDTSGSPIYGATYYSNDYEIVGTVDRAIPNAGSGVTGRFIKVLKPSNAPSYVSFLLVEVYRPALRSSEAGQVFYEFGESYPTYTGSDGSLYHTGGTANQTATTPATFTFSDGDAYYKFRSFYSDTLAANNLFQLGVMDANYADFWASAVTSNGRPSVIDAHADLTVNPVLVRFGQSFEQGTDSNGLNRFYPVDFDEYSRDNGAIMRLKARDNTLLVFQQFKTGAVPVDAQMTYNTDGTSNLILSSKLLNRIQYYRGEFGCGDIPQSIAFGDHTVWGWDNHRGVCWQLSQSGLDAISIEYGINSFAAVQSGGRSAQYPVIGVHDAFNNAYISAFADTGTLAAQTLLYNANLKGFETFLSYSPEWMGAIDNLLVSFKDGKLYTHDSTAYNTFFGVAYESSITAVFNDQPAIKKIFNKVALVSDGVWDVPSASTNVRSNGTVDGSGNALAAVYQATTIVGAEFASDDAEFFAAIGRDSHSVGGKVNGEHMRGGWLTLKFRRATATNFVFLNQVAVGVQSSHKQPNQT